MAAAKITLPTIEKGATFRHTFYWRDVNNNPINITGCTAIMQMRETIDSSVVLMELSTENQKIIIDGHDGIINLYISAEDTRELSGLGAIYDLEIHYPDLEVVRFCEGRVKFSGNVTR